MPFLEFKAIVPKRPIKAGNKRAVMLPLGRFGRRVQSRVSKYPPPPAGSTYRRTGDLGTGWTKDGPRSIGQDIMVKVGNKVAYGPFVQGFVTQDPRQLPGSAAIGWPSIETVSEDEWRQALPEIQRAIQKG